MYYDSTPATRWRQTFPKLITPPPSVLGQQRFVRPGRLSPQQGQLPGGPMQAPVGGAPADLGLFNGQMPINLFGQHGIGFAGPLGALQDSFNAGNGGNPGGPPVAPIGGLMGPMQQIDRGNPGGPPVAPLGGMGGQVNLFNQPMASAYPPRRRRRF